MGGAAEVYSALHNVNVGVVPGGAEGVVVVVAVVILRAEFATDVFGEVKLEAVVGALTGFGKAIGGAACRVLIGFFEGYEFKRCRQFGVSDELLTLCQRFGSRLPSNPHR